MTLQFPWIEYTPEYLASLSDEHLCALHFDTVSDVGEEDRAAKLLFEEMKRRRLDGYAPANDE